MPAWSFIDLSALWLTLKVAGVATLFAMALGVAFGLFIARTRWPGRRWLESLLTLPLVLPPTVLGYYLIVLLGRNSALGGWLAEHLGISPSGLGGTTRWSVTSGTPACWTGFWLAWTRCVTRRRW
jgi:ABC-type sulfate transport system permease component